MLLYKFITDNTDLTQNNISLFQNKKHKAYLYERIAKRKKLLSYLRVQDYDRFLWLLKELKLTYTPVKQYDYFTLGKRALEKKRIREELYAEMTTKIKSVKERIEVEKENFLQEKEKVLEEIDNAVKNNIVTQEEIDQIYTQHIEERKKLKERHPKPVRSGWKKLNDYIEKEEERKEREKWVFN